MKVCIVAEGCYPYVVGGVSGWINSMIQSFPNVEFILLTIVADRSFRGRFVYELPENLTQVYEIYLEDFEWVEGKKTERFQRNMHLSKKEYAGLLDIVMNRKTDWGVIFDLFHKERVSVGQAPHGAGFFQIVENVTAGNIRTLCFPSFLWTMRSIYLPLSDHEDGVPKSWFDCVATGYAGVLEVWQAFHGAR